MDCLLCGKELEKNEEDLCESCFQVMKLKYPKNKLREVIKWHEKNAKKLKK